MLDQKSAFQERIQRINSGKQFEATDVIGKATQKRFNQRLALRPKKRRCLADNLMVLVGFLSGAAAVFLGRLAYFHLSQVQGLPEAFYDLQNRGMMLFALVLAGIMVVMFHLSTRTRMQALVAGCAVMYFGETAVAATVPDLWSKIYSPAYTAHLVQDGILPV